MAWNEPGGGKDPWGGNNDQGPPDLDEALRKFQERLNGMFGGGKRSSGGNDSGSGIGSGALLVIAVVALLFWGALGFYQLDEQERAVVLRFGKYHETVGPGLHWNPPVVDQITRINVTKVRTSAHRGQMLTEDENIVELLVSVQYTVRDHANFVLKVKDPERSLEHAAESAMRHVVGSNEMHGVLTDGREQIAVEIKDRLQQYLDSYETGIFVVGVNIENAQPPSEVQAAFDDVIKAREDEVRAKNEAEAYANQIVPEARGRAQRAIEEAQAYKAQVTAEAEGHARRFEQLLTEYVKAPQVTRERLYLETMSNVLSSSSKILVNSEGGNNMLYLPLDQLMRRQAALPSGSSVSSGSYNPALSDQDLRSLTDRVIEQLRSDRQSRREGR